jgi:hypothetical protein
MNEPTIKEQLRYIHDRLTALFGRVEALRSERVMGRVADALDQAKADRLRADSALANALDILHNVQAELRVRNLCNYRRVRRTRERLATLKARKPAKKCRK